MVTLLLTAGASIDSCDLVKFTPLHYAAWFGKDQILQYLLTAGASVECVSCVGQYKITL